MKSLKPFFQDLKAFAVRGNVADMAVGIIVGAAFGKIVSSLVNDIVMPPIGLLLGGTDFKDLRWELSPAQVVNGVEKASVAINYGAFLQNVFDFIIIVCSIFLFIKCVSALKRKHPAASDQPEESAPSRQEELLAEIRDLLKKK